jgi:hypothetical protein
MERLETINKKILGKILIADDLKISKIKQTSFEYAINESDLSEEVIVLEILNKIKTKSQITEDDGQKILALSESFDNHYSDLDEQGEEIEALKYFSKARATMAIFYGIKHSLTEERKYVLESVYEALLINDDAEILFNVLERID